MPNMAPANLHIWLRSPDKQELLLNFTGYHGLNWNTAQVSWSARKYAQVNSRARDFFLPWSTYIITNLTS